MISQPTFDLVFADPNQSLIKALKQEFEPYSRVGTHIGRFEDVPFDCVVSPANSFGLMDGGVDEAITMYFGQQMMDRVQEKVIEHFAGEQPVGTSMIVRGTEIDDPNVKFVAHTPTMMIPMNIGHTTNVYMAFKSMLLAVEAHNKNHSEYPINIVVCPGMGTGAGRVPYLRAASAMREAYQNAYNPPKEISWEFATTRYNNIRNAHNVQ